MRHLRTVLLAAITLASSLTMSAKAQSRTAATQYSSAALDSLFMLTLRGNYNQPSLDGYRVQIYSGSGPSAKKAALDAKANFLKLFPNERVYVRYDAPFWRVRVGDFRFRSEALPLLSRVKRHFAGSYTVKDNNVRKKTFK